MKTLTILFLMAAFLISGCVTITHVPPKSVVLKKVDIIFADTSFIEDVAVNLQSSEMRIHQMTVSYEPLLNELINSLVKVQKKHEVHAYIFIGGTKGVAEIIRIGYCPKGENPPEI